MKTFIDNCAIGEGENLGGVPREDSHLLDEVLSYTPEIKSEIPEQGLLFVLWSWFFA